MIKRPSLILVEKTRRAVYRGKPREAVLGDGTGNIYAPDGRYYCRWPGPADENGNATYSTRFSVFGGGKNFVTQNNRRVYIVQNHKGQLEIDGAVYEDLQAAKIKPSIMNPNEPRRQFTRLDDIQNFKAIPIKGTMKVRVGELFYVDRNGIPRWFPGTIAIATAGNPAVHVDLTAHRPATDDYECFGLISFNQDEWALGNNPLEVSVSTAQSSIPSTVGIADIQEAYAGMSAYALPVKAFRLREGITNLDDVEDRKKDLEGRQFVNVPQTDASGITQLTGDVTATGPGSVAATIANNAITQAKMADNSVGTAELLNDNVTLAKLADGTGIGTGIGYNVNNAPYETANAVDIPAIMGENVNLADLFYLKSDGKFWIADAGTAAAISSVRGMGLDAGGLGTTDSPNIIRAHGFIDGFGGGLTDGLPIYLGASPVTYDQTVPSPSLGGAQITSVRYGHAASTSIAFIDTRFPVRYMKRVSLADGATTTITHYADVTPAERKVYAMVSADDIAIVETSGGAQDSSRQLKGQSGAGSTVTVDTAGTTLARLGNNGTAQFEEAQSVTLTAGTLTGITFALGANTGSPTGDLTVELRDNNAGIPGALLWTTTHTPTPSANNTVTVTGGPFVDAGVYWLNIRAVTQASNVGYNLQYNNGSVYAGGVLKADSSATPGTWATFGTTQDLRCTVTTSALVTIDGLAQGFSHSSTQTVSYVDLLLKRTGTLATENLTLAIYSNSAGLPGSVITNGTAATRAASDVTTGYTLIRFTWGTDPTVTASTQYHIVLTTSGSASNTAYIEWGIDQSSPPYANGAFAQLQSASWAASSPGADGIFDLYGVVTTFGEPAVIGRWSGGTRDIAVRYDNGSASNPTTNTTFKNTSGVTLDVTCIVEMP